MRLILGVIILSCTGCANVEPFARVSLTHQLDQHSDYYRSTDREWECSKNLGFEGEVGVETPKHWEFSIEHESWVFCGNHNNTQETYTHKLKVSKKFGGQ